MHVQTARATIGEQRVNRLLSLGACVAALALPLIALDSHQKPREQTQQTTFRVFERGGTWSFVDPGGRDFFSIGINVICPTDSGGPHGPHYDGLADNGDDAERWRSQTLQRLSEWNINTVGAWSSLRGMPYVIELSLSYSWIDVFDEGFESHVRKAALAASRWSDIGADFSAINADPLLLGYFTDNEWNGGRGYRWSGIPGDYSLFEYYAEMASTSAGKREWVRFMTERYRHDWSRVSAVWNVSVTDADGLISVKKIAPRSREHLAESQLAADDFLRTVARRYFEVTTQIMRRHLPGRLNLGTRMTPGVPTPAVEVAGRFVDVISFNIYTRDIDECRRELTRLHVASGRPVLLSEFAFPARENRSGNRNRKYETAEVGDNVQRGQRYSQWAEQMSRLPFLIGFHWFQYYDEPTFGRADGESVNFGFVDVHNRVYEALSQAATHSNVRALTCKNR